MNWQHLLCIAYSATFLWLNGDRFCKQTKDEDGSTNKKETDFHEQYGPDGETFDHGYYSYDGYDAETYNGIDDFDFY